MNVVIDANPQRRANALKEFGLDLLFSELLSPFESIVGGQRAQSSFHLRRDELETVNVAGIDPTEPKEHVSTSGAQPSLVVLTLLSLHP